MDEFLRNLFESSSGLGAYLTVFGVLVACGLGVPLPEDISLILGGYLAHTGAANLPIMMVVGLLGILIGDSMIFAAGRRVGNGASVQRGFLARIVTPEKRAKVEHLFQKHGHKVVMIARFMPGVRAVTYFTAGSARMPYARFILWDGLAALVSAPVFVYLGYYFGGQLERLIQGLKNGQVVVIGGLVAAAVAYGLYRWNRNKVAKRQLEAERAAMARGELGPEHASHAGPPPAHKPTRPTTADLS